MRYGEKSTGQKFSRKYYAIQWHGYLGVMNESTNKVITRNKMAANIIHRH
jgi:hypothetical protein